MSKKRPVPSSSPREPGKPIRWQSDLQNAKALAQAGRWQEAGSICLAILASYPRQFDAAHLLGVAYLRTGQVERAAEQLARAVELSPEAVGPRFDLGNALHGLARLDEALASFDKALAREARLPNLHLNRANVLRDLGRPADALSGYDRALALQPDHAAALVARAEVLATLGREEEALAAFGQAAALHPSATLFFKRANALRMFGRSDEALADYGRAIFREPTHADSVGNRAAMLAAVGRPEEALTGYDRLLALRPASADAHYNRGSVLRDLGRLEEAVASYDKAVALRPDDAEARRDRGLTRLLAGRFPEGWADHEQRWRMPAFAASRPALDAPHWTGEDLTEKSLLVYAEQGLGDTIQFARYLPLLAARARAVTLLAPARLCTLLRTLPGDIAIVANPEEVGDVNLQCALMDLPARFGTDLATIPAQVPYLAADSARVERWKRVLGPGGFKIGVAWQGNPKGKVDVGRSVPVAAFQPLAEIPGVRLISLQRTHGLDQVDGLPDGMRLEILDDGFDAGPDAFADTAAVMANLDLIVSVDTSVAHLAGALARPTWVALKRVPDWRWLLDRADSPWYPTMRLFRQKVPGDWGPVFAEMAAEIGVLAAGRDHHGR